MIESLLSAIEGLLAVGFVVGLLVGVSARTQKVSCPILLAVPVAMIAYVSWQQGQHPENLRSTSGLDFVFGPFWPSIGALVGFYAGRALRKLVQKS